MGLTKNSAIKIKMASPMDIAVMATIFSKIPSLQHLGSRNLKCVDVGDALAPNTLAWRKLCVLSKLLIFHFTTQRYPSTVFRSIHITKNQCSLSRGLIRGQPFI